MCSNGPTFYTEHEATVGERLRLERIAETLDIDTLWAWTEDADTAQIAWDEIARRREQRFSQRANASP